MSRADLVTRAEVQLLADNLAVDVTKVEHLERLGADGVRALRTRISDMLFDEQGALFARVSKLAPLVPNALVAKIAQAIVPPLAAGRAAGALGVDHQDRVADLLARLSPEYMADCAPHLDPRAIKVIAPVVDGKTIVPAANELLRRKAYATAAQFIDPATPQQIRDFEAGIDDDAGLLLVAARTPSAERLSEIIRLLPKKRVARIIESAARTPETQLAGLSVLSRIDAELTAELGAILFDSLDDGQLDEVLNTAVENDALPELRTLLGRVPAEARKRALARSPLADRRAELTVDT